MTTQSVLPADKLKFRYIVAYLVEGLQAPSAEFGRWSYSDNALGKKIDLTDHSHESWTHIDTAITIGTEILTTMFQGASWSANNFRQHVSEITQERLKRYGTTSAFLVLEAMHEEEAARIGTIGESEHRDHCVALPNGFRDEVEARHKTFVEQAQSFLYFAMPSVSGFQQVGSCIVADHPSGKPLYTLTASMNARLTVSGPIPTGPEDGPELLTSLFQHAHKLEVFGSTFRLFAGSATNVRDNLRAFLFAFTALETFLSRLFKNYKQRLFRHRENALSEEILTYVEAIEQRRKAQGRTEDDYPIAYKFALIASYLGLADLGASVDNFDRVTGDRNAIAHGYDFNEAALPTAEVWVLLRQLIRSYMKHERKPERDRLIVG